MEDINHWDDILKVLKEKDYQPKILCPEKKKSCKNKENIKTFPDKQKLREFITTKPSIQENTQGVLQADMRGHKSVTLLYVKK